MKIEKEGAKAAGMDGLVGGDLGTPLQHVKAKATQRATSAGGGRHLASMVPPITVPLGHPDS